MIYLEFDGLCQDCKCADLELDCLRIESFDNNNPTRKVWTVSCIHADACDHIEDITIERLTKK